MNHYLTIGEFAKLRGVNINSLLYYEKLGILLPAYVDPDSRYRMQADLRKIEYSLQCQEDQDSYAACTGIYQREIAARFFIVEEYVGNLTNITQFGRISTQLFDYAESKGLSTLLPTGFMFLFGGGEVRQYLFYEVLPTEETDEKVIQLPGGTWTCLQMEFNPDLNHVPFLEQKFGVSDRRIAVFSNLTRDQLKINSRYNEIQVLDGYTIPGSKK